MAYTAWIFYLDYELGSDTTRTTLTSVGFSNPSGTIVRATKTAHGLVTGAVVTVSLTTNFNATWKITKITDDTFDLDTASTPLGADVTWSVVPFWWQSWADARKTMTWGATAARIAPADIIRIAKSPAPISLWTTGIWTNWPKPATVTITSSTFATPIEVTKVAHWYITWDIVQITAHTVNTTANGVWTVTYVTADIFSLDNSAWVGTGWATWTHQKINAKTVVLWATQNLTIDNADIVWTGAGDTTTALVLVATTGKEGHGCVRLTLDASPQTSILQAYKATGDLSIAAYQKISFWFRNSAATLATHWTVRLCSDTAWATSVDTFIIPAVPSFAQWMPFTLAREGGWDLGGGTWVNTTIKSIAIYSGTVAPTASSNILIDNFIACTTSGLNLQSLISKNSSEQGWAEAWYWIQSIKWTLVLLDGDTNLRAHEGRWYSGTTETVTTYIRETIKTTMAATTGTIVQDCVDSGTLALGNIQYQGGWTVNGSQDGETFFDGLNWFGQWINSIGGQYNTLNYLNVIRYYNGILYNSSANNNTITIASNANNNTQYGVYFVTDSNDNIATLLSHVNNNWVGGVGINNVSNNKITTLTNANNNEWPGVAFTLAGNNNIIETITNVNNNLTYGVLLSVAHNNKITTITNAQNNVTAGVGMGSATKNRIWTITNANSNTYGVLFWAYSTQNFINLLTTTGNSTASLYASSWSNNYINKATLAESVKFAVNADYADNKVFINNIWGFVNVWWESGNIVSQNATAWGTGIEWRMNVTNTLRGIKYPLTLSVAKIAVVADKAVDVSLFFRKSHATDIEWMLVCRGWQLNWIAADVTTIAPSDTNRNSVALATMTPTESGVLEIEVWSYRLSNVADENVIVDDILITQA